MGCRVELLPVPVPSLANVNKSVNNTIPKTVKFQGLFFKCFKVSLILRSTGAWPHSTLQPRGRRDETVKRFR